MPELNLMSGISLPSKAEIQRDVDALYTEETDTTKPQRTATRDEQEAALDAYQKEWEKR